MARIGLATMAATGRVGWVGRTGQLSDCRTVGVAISQRQGMATAEGWPGLSTRPLLIDYGRSCLRELVNRLMNCC